MEPGPRTKPNRRAAFVRAGAASVAFFIPLIVATAYLNMGQTCSCGSTCPPAPPDFRVSKSTGGIAADDASTDGAVAAQGNDIAFASYATNLDPAAASVPGPHVFVHNISTKATDWVSLAALGEPDAIGSGSPVLSEYGQFIAFEQQFFGVPPTHAIIFRDLDAATPSFETIVSTGTTPVSDPAMSGDGRYVAFATPAALLPEDTDALSDIYVMDRQTGSLRFMSGGAGSGQIAFGPVLSRDGQVLAYEAQTVPLTPVILATDITGDAFVVALLGVVPSLTDDGMKIAYRERASGADRIWTDETLGVSGRQEVSIDSSGIPSTDDCDDPVISGNGRYVAFSCVAPMTDHGALNQVYVRDLVEQTTKLASITDTGVPANSADSKPVGMPANGNAVIIESSADNLGDVPGGFPQLFRIPIGYWSEGGSSCLNDDTTCDGVDDDCDGQTDEDYVSQPTSCGVGACASTGSTSCSGGQVVDSCVPGTPSSGEACDGVDNNCNGVVDEDAGPVQVTCQVGGCTAVATGPCGATPDCTAVGVCVSEANCADGLDNDGDGLSDCADTDCFNDAACANGAPVLDPVPVTTVTVGQTLSFTLSGSDPDGDPITFGAAPLPLPANASLDGDTGEFRFAPTLSQVSSFALDFTASDGRNVASQTTVITVMAPTPGGLTAVTGVLYDAVDAAAGNPVRPVVGATITDLANPANTATTDANGAFTLEGLTPGLVTIEFDGSTAALPPQPVPAPPEPVVYGAYRATMTVESGTTKQMFRPIYVPRIDGPTEYVSAGSTTTLTNPNLPGVMVEVQGDFVVDENGEPYAGPLRVSSVPPEFTPGALPDTLNPSTVLTLQPMGIRFTQPAAVTFPNDLGLAPGSEVDIWSLDHSAGVFFIAGEGVVSSDGSVINSKPGEGLVETSWHFPAPPAPDEEEEDGTGDDGESEGGSEEGGEEEGDSEEPEQPNDPDDEDPGAPPEPDPCEDLASSVPLGKGKVRVEVSMPSYKMLNDPFAHKLVYDSSRAFPYYLLPVNAQISVRSAVPPFVSYETTVGGAFSNDTRYVDTTGFVESADEPFRVVAGVDAHDRDTGILPVQIRITSHFPDATTGTDATFGTVLQRTLPVINGRNSPFGAGWEWSGVRRLIPVGSDGQDRLMVQGGGGYRTFRFVDGAFVSSAGDASTLIENPDGTFTLQRIDGVETQFDTQGRQIRIDFPNNIQWQYDYDTNGLLSEIIDGAGGRTVIEYQSGVLWKVTDPVNRVTEFEHDNGDLVLIKFPDGSERGFGYDANHLMTSETSPRYFTKYRIFDSAGRLKRVVLEDESQRHVTPASTIGFIPPSSDLGRTKQNAAPFVRPDRTTTIVDAEGRSRSFEIGRYGQVTKATDPAGLATIFERDGDGNLVRLVKPSGQTYAMTYDGNKNMLTRTDEALNGTTTYTYEPLRNQVATITDDEGDTTTFIYYPSGDLEKVISPLNREVTMSYYPDGTLETVTDPLSRVTRFDYDGNGNLETITVTAGAESRVTSFVNASSGYPQSVTNPLMQSLSTPRDDWNRPTSITDDAGQTTALSYDPSGNLKTLTPPFSAPSEPQVHTFLYDEREWNTDYVPPEIDGQDLRTRYARNAESQTELVTLPDGRSVDYDYDTEGRRESTTIARIQHTVEYNPSTGLPERLVGSDQTEITFSYLGDRLSRVVSDGGQSVSYSYNTTGLLSSLSVQGQPQDCDQSSTIATWPADGSAVDPVGGYDAVENGGVTYVPGLDDQAFSFDGDDDYLTATVPVDGATNLTFGLWFRMREAPTQTGILLYMPRNEQGPAIQITVDPQRELTARVQNVFFLRPCDLGSCATFDDGLWHHVAVVFETPSTTPIFRLYVDGVEVDMVTSTGVFDFDATNELSIGGLGFLGFPGEIDRTTIYNAALTPAEVLCEAGLLGDFVYAYDADGAIKTAGDVTMGYYSDTGLLDTVSLGDLQKKLTYHPFGEVFTETTTVQSTQTAVHDVSYTPDSLGRIASKTETIQGVSTAYDYAYDNTGRLEEVWMDGVRTEWYSYDPNGNRKTLNTPTQTTTAEYDEQDRLESYGGNTYTYRQSGELLTKTASGGPPTTYDYDELGNLVSVTLPGGSVIEYEIDPMNRRVGRKFDGEVTHRWIYQDRLNPVAELDADGILVALFVYGTRSHVPDAMIKNGTRYLFVTDQVGSVRLVLNSETGAVVQRIDYDAWGNVLSDSNPGFQPFGFAGGLYDGATKLVRFGARDYDPEVGRWTAKDPIKFAGGDTDLYSYSHNDPVNVRDGTGLAPFCNYTNDDIRVGGGTGPEGEGEFGEGVVEPFQCVNADEPLQTDEGPLYDVDVADFNGDGIVDPPRSLRETFPFGEKILGGSRGVVCGAVPNPYPFGPPRLPYPVGFKR